MAATDPSIQVTLAGVRLASPVIAAAGTCGYADELADAMDLAVLGAVTTKSITPESRAGNDPWRIVDVPGGMMNAIGLANVGLDAFLSDKLPRVAALPCPAIGSVAGHSVDDYVRVAAAFDARPELPILELNVSCPNTATGTQFGDDPAALRALLQAVRPAVTRSRLFVKLSPAGDTVRLAATAAECGADGLTLVNTMPAMSIDVHTRKPRLSRGRGGLSGPAIHPVAVRIVHDVHRSVAKQAGIPIIGLGGAIAWQDAAEFVLAGATAVGMGTMLFADPWAPAGVVRGLAGWVRAQGVRSISELVGALEA